MKIRVRPPRFVGRRNYRQRRRVSSTIRVPEFGGSYPERVTGSEKRDEKLQLHPSSAERKRHSRQEGDNSQNCSEAEAVGQSQSIAPLPSSTR